MKLLAFISLAVLTICEAVAAQSVTLAWNASGETNVAYILYAYTNSIQNTAQIGTNKPVVRAFVGTNLTCTLEAITNSTYSFAVTAYWTNGPSAGLESDFSNWLILSVPRPPTNLRTIVPQWSATITNFTDFGYFRIRIL